MRAFPAVDGSDSFDSTSSAALLENDLTFFQLLVSLIQESTAIDRIDLRLKDHEALRACRPQSERIASPLLGRYTRCGQSGSPSAIPGTCAIAGSGRDQFLESAETRAGNTHRSMAYRCPCGCVALAAPVLCDGFHIATLFGEIAARSRSRGPGMPGPCTGAEELFEAGSQTTSGSCQQIPGSPDADILRAIGLLGSLAGYLATAWKRLFEAEGAAQLQLRESKLVRQEMAQMLLRGDIDESEQLREIARSLGFATYPNRIVVVAPSREEPHGLESFSRNIELDSLQRAIEELVKKDRNILVARVHRKCVCIFFAEITGSDGSRNDEKVLAMAKRVVHSIYKTCNLRVRAGIGRATADWRTIVNSYQEAWVALRYSDSSVAAFEPTVSSVDSQFDHLAAICDPLMRNDQEQLRSVMHSTFVTAARTLVNIEGNIAPLRQFLLVVVGGVLATSRTLDQDKIFLESWSREMCRALDAAGNVHELGELWSRSADRLLVELGRVSSGKHLKLTNLAQTYIHRNIYSHHGARPVVMEEVAALLGVSVGHLSRIFKRTAGITFERYVMEKRIERAQKLLLDPVSRVSEVADKCDFCNPAYFARTFRQIVGCSPSEFSRHPSLYQVAK